MVTLRLHLLERGSARGISTSCMQYVHVTKWITGISFNRLWAHTIIHTATDGSIQACTQPAREVSAGNTALVHCYSGYCHHSRTAGQSALVTISKQRGTATWSGTASALSVWTYTTTPHGASGWRCCSSTRRHGLWS